MSNPVLEYPLTVVCRGHNLPGTFKCWLKGIYPGAIIRCDICNREWRLRQFDHQGYTVTYWREL